MSGWFGFGCSVEDVEKAKRKSAAFGFALTAIEARRAKILEKDPEANVMIQTTPFAVKLQAYDKTGHTVIAEETHIYSQ